MSTKTNNSKEKRKEQLNAYARYSAVAFQMFAIIGGGTYLGVKLDEWYPNKHNLYTVILSLVAVIMAIVFVIRQVIGISKEKN
ncbi:MAG: hypothetical protein CSA39_01685 [Flavobacteriales bacterium]|nr:MAG: hypothetical protein CR989_03005 [Flavobacteriales bacterium]PIE49633.1 MAG: hypothetical protein CSA39_01685 [Flavobacteriales bacterium]